MAEIKVDTKKMRECGSQMIDISLNLGEEFNNLFERLANIPYKTKEWSGEAAVAFAERSKSEKAQYVQLKETIYKMGKHLVEQADYLDNEIDSLRRDSNG